MPTPPPVVTVSSPTTKMGVLAGSHGLDGPARETVEVPHHHTVYVPSLQGGEQLDVPRATARRAGLDVVVLVLRHVRPAEVSGIPAALRQLPG